MWKILREKIHSPKNQEQYAGGTHTLGDWAALRALAFFPRVLYLLNSNCLSFLAIPEYRTQDEVGLVNDNLYLKSVKIQMNKPLSIPLAKSQRLCGRLSPSSNESLTSTQASGGEGYSIGGGHLTYFYHCTVIIGFAVWGRVSRAPSSWEEGLRRTSLHSPQGHSPALTQGRREEWF